MRKDDGGFARCRQANPSKAPARSLDPEAALSYEGGGVDDEHFVSSFSLTVSASLVAPIGI
jgi:hypothetical protein